MKAIMLALALGACGAAQAPEPLGEAVRSYNDGVRWERFAVAASHVPPTQRSTFVDEADERAKDLKITDYEIVRVDQTSDRVAVVQVKMSWYRDSEGSLKETQAIQTWERHGKTWLMVDEVRLRGKEMLGLREPPTTDEKADPATDETAKQ